MTYLFQQTGTNTSTVFWPEPCWEINSFEDLTPDNLQKLLTWRLNIITMCESLKKMTKNTLTRTGNQYKFKPKMTKLKYTFFSNFMPIQI